jgi:hypothetical protein
MDFVVRGGTGDIGGRKCTKVKQREAGRISLTAAKLGPDGNQFRARLIVNPIKPARAAIPIPGIAEVAFDLVQHSMKPRGRRIVFMLLHQFMRRVPIAGLRQFDGFQQLIVRQFHWHFSILPFFKSQTSENQLLFRECGMGPTTK